VTFSQSVSVKNPVHPTRKIRCPACNRFLFVCSTAADVFIEVNCRGCKQTVVYLNGQAKVQALEVDTLVAPV